MLRCCSLQRHAGSQKKKTRFLQALQFLLVSLCHFPSGQVAYFKNKFKGQSEYSSMIHFKGDAILSFLDMMISIFNGVDFAFFLS